MRYQRQILILVCAISLAIGFFVTWNPSKVLAAVSCKGEGTTTLPSCTGKFAGYQGCAATNASDQITGHFREQRLRDGSQKIAMPNGLA